MSHPRIRKQLDTSGNGTRRRYCLETSVDCTVSNIDIKQRSRNSNKIPKSIRYELENALVGLCNVWFEEIKPHLVRNNIKVHVHNSEGAGKASGDHQRLPPGAPGCSHLDPGAASDLQPHLLANCAGCCSTQRAASRAQCHRQPARFPPRMEAPATHMIVSNQCPKCENKNAKVPRKYRKKCFKQYETQFLQYNWRVPRLCRTNGCLPPRSPTIYRTSCSPSYQNQTAKSWFAFLVEIVVVVCEKMV
ncbi:uncharacterized protein LOC116413536 isoform X2 [Galleria mellonella]|uniref:Uncharacterized protein LOC116413536 isoform X2 n=1 Tax=Galleria mellonella TaxID=7137 RepID=A0ABM3N6J7_GALME|nr:uncharacterized protein LOC116413536 isoform X2 [Galleria mellonella]